MSRPAIATIAGLLFVAAYIVAAVVFAGAVGRWYWPIEALYWAVAGIVWVLPIRWLMLWSVHKR